MGLSCIYLGHSGFVFSNGKDNVIIDPFLTGNPLAHHTPEKVSGRTIVLTHGHEDHVGDTWDIAKRNGATVITCYEISLVAGEHGRSPEATRRARGFSSLLQS